MLLLLVLPRLGAAMDVSQWKSEQAIDITVPGPTKLTLPPETLDAAASGLTDLRLLDNSGHEVPFLIEHASPTTPATRIRPKTWRVSLAGSSTEVVIETGTLDPLDSIVLETPAPAFLKPARLETSTDGEHWNPFGDGLPFFRQFGAEQLRFDLKHQSAAWLRLTIDDSRSRPLPITGATLFVAREVQPAPTTPLGDARISQREEFAGATVLTLNLSARHVPLATLEFDTPDQVFTRKVTVLTRELRDETAVEHTLATGTIFRLALDGLEPTAQLSVPLAFDAPARELTIRIENGDSPPLAIDHVVVRQRPVWLVFNAAVAGHYELLTGNDSAAAPRYDLSTFASRLRDTKLTGVTPGPLAPNPRFQAVDRLADAPLLGAPIDVSGWSHARAVRVQTGGIQQLELDPAVLAGTANDCADLRLVRDGKQLPYLIERPPLSRTLRLPFGPAALPNAPRVSRWELKLPQPGIPITRLTLRTTTPIFQRWVRVLETANDERSGSFDRVLAESDWHRTPGAPDTLSISLAARPQTATLHLETDNGDNPPITLTSADVAYPVVRLLFKVDPGPVTLYYGKQDALAPRYDIALIAGQLLAAEKHIATLDATPAAAAARTGIAATHAGLLFWSALGLVVLVLLGLVAKLLPKQNDSGSDPR